jgi:hypothetical protein
VTTALASNGVADGSVNEVFWAAFGGGVGGAVVGGLATLVLQWRGRLRAARARVYDELLPDFANPVNDTAGVMTDKGEGS